MERGPGSDESRFVNIRGLEEKGKDRMDLN